MALGSNLKRKKDSLFPKKKKVALKANPGQIKQVKESPPKEVAEKVIAKMVAKVIVPEPQENFLNIEKMYTMSVQPSKRKKVKKTKVILEGDLTILEAQSIKDEIVPLFDTYDFVDITLNNIGKLDLSCVQLLYAIKSHFSEIGKTVTIDSELPPDLKTVINRAGFTEVLYRTPNT